MVNGSQTRKEGTDAKKPVIVVTRRNVLVMIEMRRNVQNMFNIMERKTARENGLFRTVENMGVGNHVASVANGAIDEYVNICTLINVTLIYLFLER